MLDQRRSGGELDGKSFGNANVWGSRGDAGSQVNAQQSRRNTTEPGRHFHSSSSLAHAVNIEQPLSLAARQVYSIVRPLSPPLDCSARRRFQVSKSLKT